jgi:hypothetical protein
MEHSPFCAGTPRYYDGALGYEAVKCDVCGYELDLNAEANAKATAERLARERWPSKAEQEAFWQKKLAQFQAFLNECHEREQASDWTETVRRKCEEGDPRY